MEYRVGKCYETKWGGYAILTSVFVVESNNTVHSTLYGQLGTAKCESRIDARTLIKEISWNTWFQRWLNDKAASVDRTVTCWLDAWRHRIGELE